MVGGAVMHLNEMSIIHYKQSLVKMCNSKAQLRELNVVSVRGSDTGARILTTSDSEWTLEIVGIWRVIFFSSILSMPGSSD